MRILIVEDEKRLAASLGQIMEENKYTVDIVYNGEDGLDWAMSGIYDVVILDVMLPGLDGFSVVRRLRQAANATPVIMLTARDEVSDRVAGLDSGADDYLTKPFSPAELVARVRALCRRPGGYVADELCVEDLVLELSAYRLRCGPKAVNLGVKEYQLLQMLMGRPGAVVPKEEMLVKVWGTESDAEDNNVEVYISFLRKKLIYLGTRVTIGTVRKIGYRLEGQGQ